MRETAKTYEEAEKVLRKLQRQVDEVQHPKSNITVRQAIEQWLEVVKLEDTTRERYDDLIRLYVLPTLGDLPAATLDAELLDRFYARLHRCRSLCSGKSDAACAAGRATQRVAHKINYGESPRLLGDFETAATAAMQSAQSSARSSAALLRSAAVAERGEQPTLENTRTSRTSRTGGPGDRAVAVEPVHTRAGPAESASLGRG